MGKKEVYSSDPDVQASLEAMGTAGVLADLAKKYRPRSPKAEPSVNLSSNEQIQNSSVDKDFDLIRHLTEKRDRFIRELEKLPHHRETFRKQKLENILRVKKQLQIMVKDFDRAASRLSKGSPEYQALCQQYIKRVMQGLDRESFWTYKFTTENSGGASSKEPLSYSTDDSVYYVTRSGISLRLKRSISEEGLGTVIQPFFEKIIFGLPNSELSATEPLVGSRVTEYRSNEFQDLLNQERIFGDFESMNDIYLKDGKIFFVKSNDRNPHEGDRVNEILMTR